MKKIDINVKKQDNSSFKDHRNSKEFQILQVQVVFSFNL